MHTSPTFAIIVTSYFFFYRRVPFFPPRPRPTVVFDASFKKRDTRDFKTNAHHSISEETRDPREIVGRQSALFCEKSLRKFQRNFNRTSRTNRRRHCFPLYNPRLSKQAQSRWYRHSEEAKRFDQAFRALRAENQRGTERVGTAARRERGKRILASG